MTVLARLPAWGLVRLAWPRMGRRPWRRGAGLLVLAASLTLGGASAAAQDATAGAPSSVTARTVVHAGDGPGVESSSDARAEQVEVDARAGAAAVKAAAQAKTAAYRLEDEARTAALLEVARQYDVVAATRRFGRAARAEAAFRSGELLRARGRAEEALERFALALSVGEAGEPGEPARGFAARALLEQGHGRRRAEDVAGALTLYGQVLERFGDEAARCVQARSWTVKLLVRAGRLDEAVVKVAEFLAAHPDRVLEAVRAADELAEALVAAGRSDEARQLAADLENRVLGSTSDEAVTGRLASALDALRVTVSESGY